MKLIRLTVNWVALFIFMPIVFIYDITGNFIDLMKYKIPEYKYQLEGKSKAKFKTGTKFFWEN